MKKIIFSLLSLIFICSISPLKAQSIKEKSKLRKTEDQEIIILKKGDKDKTILLEIKDGQVYINGKKENDLDINTDSVKVRVRVSPRVNYFSVPNSGSSSFRMLPSEELVEKGGTKAFLGVSTEAAPESGARIVSVSENSAAQRSGLLNGDIIQSIDENKIASPADLVETISKYKPGTVITISFLRDGKTQTSKATLGEAKNTTIIRRNFRTLPDSPESLREMDIQELMEGTLDSTFRNLNLPGMKNFNFEFNPRPKIGVKVQDLEEGRGAKVLEITKDSPAEKAGLKTGDIITEFDGKKIEEADDMIASVKNASEKSNMNVVIKRDGKTQTLTIKIPRKLKTADL